MNIPSRGIPQVPNFLGLSKLDREYVEIDSKEKIGYRHIPSDRKFIPVCL